MYNKGRISIPVSFDKLNGIFLYDRISSQFSVVLNTTNRIKYN